MVPLLLIIGGLVYLFFHPILYLMMSSSICQMLKNHEYIKQKSHETLQKPWARTKAFDLVFCCFSFLMAFWSRETSRALALWGTEQMEHFLLEAWLKVAEQEKHQREVEARILVTFRSVNKNWPVASRLSKVEMEKLWNMILMIWWIWWYLIFIFSYKNQPILMVVIKINQVTSAWYSHGHSKLVPLPPSFDVVRRPWRGTSTRPSVGCRRAPRVVKRSPEASWNGCTRTARAEPNTWGGTVGFKKVVGKVGRNFWRELNLVVKRCNCHFLETELGVPQSRQCVLGSSKGYDTKPRFHHMVGHRDIKNGRSCKFRYALFAFFLNYFLILGCSWNTCQTLKRGRLKSSWKKLIRLDQGRLERLGQCNLAERLCLTDFGCNGMKLILKKSSKLADIRNLSWDLHNQKTGLVVSFWQVIFSILLIFLANKTNNNKPTEIWDRQGCGHKHVGLLSAVPSRMSKPQPAASLPAAMVQTAKTGGFLT